MKTYSITITEKRGVNTRESKIVDCGKPTKEMAQEIIEHLWEKADIKYIRVH